jgi:two-component system nitrate/nitrite response regulator NarL
MLRDIHVSILSHNEIGREGLRRILAERSCTIDDTVSDPAALMPPNGHPAERHIVIVVDTDPVDSIALCRQLRERVPAARILLMADEYRLEAISRAFEEGVDGYLLKSICCDGLASAIKLLSLGEKILPSQLAQALTTLRWRTSSAEWDASRAGVNLSSREVDILRCLVAGEANKLISRHLGITEATVKVHVKAVLRKLHVANRTQAAIWAVAGGLPYEEHDEDEDEQARHGSLAALAAQSAGQYSAFSFPRSSA